MNRARKKTEVGAGHLCVSAVDFRCARYVFFKMFCSHPIFLSIVFFFLPPFYILCTWCAAVSESRGHIESRLFFPPPPTPLATVHVPCIFIARRSQHSYVSLVDSRRSRACPRYAAGVLSKSWRPLERIEKLDNEIFEPLGTTLSRWWPLVFRPQQGEGERGFPYMFLEEYR